MYINLMLYEYKQSLSHSITYDNSIEYHFNLQKWKNTRRNYVMLKRPPNAHVISSINVKNTQLSSPNQDINCSDNISLQYISREHMPQIRCKSTQYLRHNQTKLNGGLLKHNQSVSNPLAIKNRHHSRVNSSINMYKQKLRDNKIALIGNKNKIMVKLQKIALRFSNDKSVKNDKYKEKIKGMIIMARDKICEGSNQLKKSNNLY